MLHNRACSRNVTFLFGKNLLYTMRAISSTISDRLEFFIRMKAQHCIGSACFVEVNLHKTHGISYMVKIFVCSDVLCITSIVLVHNVGSVGRWPYSSVTCLCSSEEQPHRATLGPTGWSCGCMAVYVEQACRMVQIWGEGEKGYYFSYGQGVGWPMN